MNFSIKQPLRTRIVNNFIKKLKARHHQASSLKSIEYPGNYSKVSVMETIIWSSLTTY